MKKIRQVLIVTKDIAIGIVVIVLAFIIPTSFIAGSLEAIHWDFRTKSVKGCVYDSYASYFPSYILACELFRKRDWNDKEKVWK